MKNNLYNLKINSIVYFKQFQVGLTWNCFFIFIFFSSVEINIVFSQTYDNLFLNPYRQRESTVFYGFDKLTNTYLFTGNADIYQNLFGGVFYFSQKYRGTAIKTSTSSYRDDELFNFSFYYPTFENISILARQNWLLSSDSRSIGINKLERLNGLLGMRYQFMDNSFIEAIAGMENNNQIGIYSKGEIFNLNGKLSDIKFEGFSIESTINSEYLKLNYDRINSNIDLNLLLGGSSGENSNLSLKTGYQIINRDYLSPTSISNEIIMPVESRLEKKLTADFSMDFALSQPLGGNIKLSLSDMNVNRDNKKDIESIQLSKVLRKLNELILSAQGEFYYKTSLLTQGIGMSFFTRNEENRLEKKFNIPEQQENYLRSSENQRDNNSSRTRLFLKTIWLPFRMDSLSFNYSVSLFQYDTPSDLNNDDRDEYSTIMNIYYSHKFSNRLSVSLTSELQMTHFVFLKSEKSAMNNWNRIIRFNPAIVWNTKYFMYSPQLEVLANYTVYDYEDVSPGVNSFSFRQIGYRDTIFIKINNRTNFQIQSVLRYYERGILYWNSFKESPQNRSYEQYSKGIFYFTISNNLTIGCGGRIYLLEQKAIENYIAGYLPSGDFKQFSFGPEAALGITFDNQSIVQLRGWYEFQRIYKLDYKKIPNLFIFTTLHL
jgi:hypothetical protein